MKISKVLNLAPVLILVGVLLASCSNKTTTTTTKIMTADVKTGTISLSVTGTGNLAYANQYKLSFVVPGSVAEVPVNVGDSVKKGQELASLDTSDTSTWATQVDTLSKALTTAQRNETTQENNFITAQRNVTTKQDAVTTAQRQVSAKQLSVTQSELDLQTAQDALAAISAKLPLTVDQDQLAVASAQIALKTAQDNNDKARAKYLSTYSVQDGLSYTQTQAQLQVAQDNLAAAQNTLASDQAGPDPSQISQAKLKISQSQQALDNAKFAVDDANTAVNDAQQSVDDAEAAVSNAKQNIDDAKQAVLDAQTALDEEKNLSSVISAPFDGVITKINVAVGDNVQKGAVAVQIADPTQYEANIMVTENDIFSVKVGGAATLSLDALTGVTYPAEITAISPTATVSQGVVNYSVTVKLTSLQPISIAQSSSGQITSPPTSGTASSTTTSTPNSPSSASSATTPSAAFAQRGGGTRPSTNGTFPSVVTRNSNLKDGLSATVDIITQEAANVLEIPSRAITKNGVSYSVQVVKGTTTTTTFVTIGMTDGTNTEIKSGLSAGDQVSYTVTSTSGTSSAKKTTTTNIQQIIRGGGGAPVPGGF